MRYFNMNAQEWPPEGPEWLILYRESFDDPTPPGLQLSDPAGHKFDLVRIFPAAPLSGLHLFIYHNKELSE